MVPDAIREVSSQTVLTPSSKGDVVEIPATFSLVRPLFAVVCCALLFVGGLIVACLFVSNLNYKTGINAALAGPSPDHLAILSYSRAWDFAVVKFSTVFLAFGIILIGALYVLHKSEAGFQMTVDGPAAKGSLESSSPGLVMIALGVLLLIGALQTKSEITYTAPENTPNVPSNAVKPMPPEHP
jgi:hypothetical protein